jgi:hypothetical protein
LLAVVDDPFCRGHDPARDAYMEDSEHEHHPPPISPWTFNILGMIGDGSSCRTKIFCRRYDGLAVEPWRASPLQATRCVLQTPLGDSYRVAEPADNNVVVATRSGFSSMPPGRQLEFPLPAVWSTRRARRCSPRTLTSALVGSITS